MLPVWLAGLEMNAENHSGHVTENLCDKSSSIVTTVSSMHRFVSWRPWSLRPWRPYHLSVTSLIPPSVVSFVPPSMASIVLVNLSQQALDAGHPYSFIFSRHLFLFSGRFVFHITKRT